MELQTLNSLCFIFYTNFSNVKSFFLKLKTPLDFLFPTGSFLVSSYYVPRWRQMLIDKAGLNGWAACPPLTLPSCDTIVIILLPIYIIEK
jgi:hypothetical protein